MKLGVDLVRSIWLAPCSGLGDFQDRSLEAARPIDVSTLDPQDPLWGQGGEQRKKEREHC